MLEYYSVVATLNVAAKTDVLLPGVEMNPKLPKLLDSLVEELEAVDLATAECRLEPVGEGETVVGELSEGMKRLFVLTEKAHEHFEKLNGECRFFAKDDNSEEAFTHHRSHQQVGQRFQRLAEMFHEELHEEYAGGELANQGLGIRICGGWRVATRRAQPRVMVANLDDLPDLLKRLGRRG